MAPILTVANACLRRLSPVFKVALAFLPAALLALACRRLSGPPAEMLAWGALSMLTLPALLMLIQRGWAQAIRLTIFLTHIAALAWMWYAVPRPSGDWVIHLILALLLIAPVFQTAAYALTQTGVLLMRRARLLAMELRNRRRWPEQLHACREMPEVKAFREALQFDASPALGLLREKKPEVRLAALTALEFRKFWRTGQPEAVLNVLRHDAAPEVRAAAVAALGNIEDRRLIESVAEALRDPDPIVRSAAAAALFWDAERRWSWIRFGVRRALSEPAIAGDGSLLGEGQKLGKEALKDFTAWASEKGVLGLRATQTLAAHYSRSLQERPESTLPILNKTVQDPHAPPLLRIELAQLLCRSKDLDMRTLEALLDQANPAPLRLLAAEALLDAGPHIRAIGSLREIAKLPNRELSLLTADVIQRRLGVDLGLAIGQPLPALNSPRAVDITRKLMAWAACDDYAENALDNTFGTTHNRLTGSKHTL